MRELTEEEDRTLEMETHCRAGHEYTPENTYFYTHSRNGERYRQCQACRRIARARRKQAKPEKTFLLPATPAVQSVFALCRDRIFYVEDYAGISADWPLASAFYPTQAEYARLKETSRQRIHQLVRQGSLPTLKVLFSKRPLIVLHPGGLVAFRLFAQPPDGKWRTAAHAFHLHALASVCANQEHAGFFRQMADWLERMPQIDLLQEAQS